MNTGIRWWNSDDLSIVRQADRKIDAMMAALTTAYLTPNALLVDNLLKTLVSHASRAVLRTIFAKFMI